MSKDNIFSYECLQLKKRSTSNTNLKSILRHNCILFSMQSYNSNNNALFALRDFGFLIIVLSKHKNNNSKKKHFSFYSPPLSFSILSLLFRISFIRPISLPSSFSIFPRSFLCLSLISLHPFHMCSIVSLSS
jgi:hypothetical protein